MHLLGPLTPAERAMPRPPWAYGRGRLPVRFYRAPFLFPVNRHCQLPLTVHAHGHGALCGCGEGTVAGVALQWPAVVRTQSRKPAMGK